MKNNMPFWSLTRKNAFALVLVVLTCIIAQAQSVSKLDEKNGFKNFSFGSNVSQYKDLVYSGSLYSEYNQDFVERFDGYLDSDLKSYTQNNSTDKIGDLKISTPTYYFFDKKLMRVDFHAENWVGKELIQLYKSLYGKPVIVNVKNMLGTDVKSYVWRGNKVSLSVSICENPYRGSISSNDKNKLPSYFVRYLSIPMLSKKNGADAALRSKTNTNRAKDL